MVFDGLTNLTFSPIRPKQQNDRKYTFLQTRGVDRVVVDSILFCDEYNNIVIIL